MKALFTWYFKEREDLKRMHDKNNLPIDDESLIVRDLLIRNEHPRRFKLFNI